MRDKIHRVPLVILAVLFALTAILTAAEMATFSARVERMKQVDEAGDRRGIMVLAYQRSPMYFLAAVQLLTTAATFWAGSIMEVSLITPFDAWLRARGLSTEWANPVAAIAVLTALTLISLIFTNVLPKQIGFIRANEIAVKSAVPMLWIIRMTRPLGWLVTSVVRAWLRLSRVTPDERHRVTERDIRFLVKEGMTRGGLDRREQAIVNRALDLSEIPARTVMTPVEKLHVLDLARGLELADQEIRTSNHSYLPVIDGGLHHVVGVLRARDWLVLEEPTLKDIRRLAAPPVYIGDTEPLLHVLEVLRPVETRSVFVRNRELEVVGLITLNDAVSHVIGPMKALDT